MSCAGAVDATTVEITVTAKENHFMDAPLCCDWRFRAVSRADLQGTEDANRRSIHLLRHGRRKYDHRSPRWPTSLPRGQAPCPQPIVTAPRRGEKIDRRCARAVPLGYQA